jgi:hypothetical protein
VGGNFCKTHAPPAPPPPNFFLRFNTKTAAREMRKQHSSQFMQFVNDNSAGEASQPQPLADDTSVAGRDEEQGRGEKAKVMGWDKN